MKRLGYDAPPSPPPLGANGGWGLAISGPAGRGLSDGFCANSIFILQQAEKRRRERQVSDRLHASMYRHSWRFPSPTRKGSVKYFIIYDLMSAFFP